MTGFSRHEVEHRAAEIHEMDLGVAQAIHKCGERCGMNLIHHSKTWKTRFNRHQEHGRTWTIVTEERLKRDWDQLRRFRWPKRVWQ